MAPSEQRKKTAQLQLAHAYAHSLTQITAALISSGQYKRETVGEYEQAISDALPVVDKLMTTAGREATAMITKIEELFPGFHAE